MAIETIEHARDIRTLLDYTAKRLKPSSRLFVQSLLHQSRTYLMDDSNWMGRNFFRDPPDHSTLVLGCDKILEYLKHILDCVM